MAELLNTIVPIFVVIGVGLLAGQWGYLPEAFLGPANRLVYHLAIPAMIFRAVATGDLQRQFNLPVLAVCLGTVGAGYLVAHGAGRLQHLAREIGVGQIKETNALGQIEQIPLASRQMRLQRLLALKEPITGAIQRV